MSPALNFQAWKAPRVESGDLTQTIRALRRDGRDPKVGDVLYLFTGQRTKKCRRLGEARCSRVTPIRIAVFDTWIHQILEYQLVALSYRTDECEYLPWSIYSRSQERKIARADGFSDMVEMAEWFKKTHGLPFYGLLIRWRLS